MLMIKGVTPTVDGVSIPVGGRVLMRRQKDPRENGIFVLTGPAWSRSRDMRDERDLVVGSAVHVTGGRTMAGQSMILQVVEGARPREGDAPHPPPHALPVDIAFETWTTMVLGSVSGGESGEGAQLTLGRHGAPAWKPPPARPKESRVWGCREVQADTFSLPPRSLSIHTVQWEPGWLEGGRETMWAVHVYGRGAESLAAYKFEILVSSRGSEGSRVSLLHAGAPLTSDGGQSPPALTVRVNVPPGGWWSPQSDDPNVSFALDNGSDDTTQCTVRLVATDQAVVGGVRDGVKI